MTGLYKKHEAQRSGKAASRLVTQGARLQKGAPPVPQVLVLRPAGGVAAEGERHPHKAAANKEARRSAEVKHVLRSVRSHETRSERRGCRCLGGVCPPEADTTKRRRITSAALCAA